MDENERKPFGNLFGSLLGNEANPMTPYQSPDLAARAPAFGGYGYQAPSMNMVMAPNQMPRMAMNPEAINDPSVAAALQILNQPMMIGQMPNMMGSGTDYQEQYGLLPSIAAAPMQRAMPQITPNAGLMQYMAGGESGDHFVGGDGFVHVAAPVVNRLGMDDPNNPFRGDVDIFNPSDPGFVGPQYSDQFGPGAPGSIGYQDAMQAGGYSPSMGMSYAESVGMGGDYGYSGYSSGENRGE